MTERSRFPPPSIDDSTRQALAYVYFEDEPALPRPAVVWTLTN